MRTRDKKEDGEYNDEDLNEIDDGEDEEDEKVVEDQEGGKNKKEEVINIRQPVAWPLLM